MVYECFSWICVVSEMSVIVEVKDEINIFFLSIVESEFTCICLSMAMIVCVCAHARASVCVCVCVWLCMNAHFELGPETKTPANCIWV